MIEASTLEEITVALGDREIDETVVGDLRQRWPNIHFTCCSEDDIHSGKAVTETDRYSLYLVDSSDHCLALTSDPERATGLVVAWHSEEDEE